MSAYKWIGTELDKEIADLEKTVQDIQDPKLKAATLALVTKLKLRREAQIAKAKAYCE